MTDALLGVGKLAMLALLYLFLWRVVRVIAADLRATAPPTDQTTSVAAPRVAVATVERPAASRRPPASLVLHPPGGVPASIELGTSPIVLGRSSSVDHVLEDDYVSDEHLEISPTADGWQVRDLGSTNGSYLNGQKLVAPTPLAAGDQLQLGKTRVEVRR